MIDATCPIGTKCQECQERIKEYDVVLSAGRDAYIMRSKCSQCVEIEATERAEQKAKKEEYEAVQAAFWSNK